MIGAVTERKVAAAGKLRAFCVLDPFMKPVLSRRSFLKTTSVGSAAVAWVRERRPDRVLETNVEFWAAIVLDFAEVPAHMFTSMFTCARTGGWSAHILEQKTTGRLIRPSAIYTGPSTRPASDIEGWNADWAK